jgi:uncharacterized protein YdeI (YjbR/CyaY-like superfamily)
MNLYDCESIAEWRNWLAQNHAVEKEVWLVYYKKESSHPSLSYLETLDEALCYGWVDSLIKKIDEARYARKFTPRRETSKWSQVNKKRVEELTRDGRMMPPGLAIVEAARANGSWDRPSRDMINDQMPEEFQASLDGNPAAKRNFEKLSRTFQREYVVWVAMAKLPATRQKRIAEAVQLLEQGQKLGLR